MKKILIIITKGETGGAQVSVFNLAKKLIEQGLDVTVGFGSGTFLQQKLEKQQIPYTKFPDLGRTFNIITNLRFIWKFKKFLNSNHFDVVHFNSSNALLGALSAKLAKNKPKTVFTFRGLSMLDTNYTQSKIKIIFYKLIFKILLNFIDKQIYVSNENHYASQKLGLTRDAVVIYNGLDQNELNFFSREQAKIMLEEKLRASFKNKLVIGSIGRLAYQKNYEFLIKQASELKKDYPNLNYVIIGNGPEKKKYENLITNLDLKNTVYLVGDMPDAYQYLKAFDIFVLPSRYEGMSITLIEALYAGLSILATDIGGNHEMIKNTGLLYKLDSPQDFNEKIKLLVNNSNLKKELSLKALEKASRFDVNKTAFYYTSVYQSP